MKGHRVAEWIKKTRSILCRQETHFRYRDTHRLNVKGFHANRKAGAAILTSYKMVIKTKTNKTQRRSSDKDKGVIPARGYNICKYLYNIGALKYMKQILRDLKGETDGIIIIVGHFNTPLSSIGRPSRQEMSKETLALNDVLHQMKLTDLI